MPSYSKNNNIIIILHAETSNKYSRFENQTIAIKLNFYRRRNSLQTIKANLLPGSTALSSQLPQVIAIAIQNNTPRFMQNIHTPHSSTANTAERAIATLRITTAETRIEKRAAAVAVPREIPQQLQEPHTRTHKVRHAARRGAGSTRLRNKRRRVCRVLVYAPFVQCLALCSRALTYADVYSVHSLSLSSGQTEGDFLRSAVELFSLSALAASLMELFYGSSEKIVVYSSSLEYRSFVCICRNDSRTRACVYALDLVEIRLRGYITFRERRQLIDRF